MIRPRAILEAGILVGIALLVADHCLVAGWLHPWRVASGSMAPAVLGPHQDHQCPQCGFALTWDAATAQPLNWIFCPRCGKPLDLAAARFVDGDRLFVDRTAFAWRSPRRFEPVVFRDADGIPSIKRVIGLPTESVEIRNGDVFANGQLVRKSWEEASALAVLVHDEEFGDASARAPYRWHSTPDPRADGWTEWEYHHLAPTFTANAAPRLVESPIQDDMPYNAGESRRLRDVFDILITAEGRLSDGGEVSISISDGRERITAWFQPQERRVRVMRGEQPLQDAPISLGSGDAPIPVAFGMALIDEQVIVMCGGKETLRATCVPVAGERIPTSRPIAIRWRNGFQVTRLKVFRDVYYVSPEELSPPGSAGAVLVPNDSLFVLGDNTSVSQDSRFGAALSFLSNTAIIGKPWGVH